MQSRDRKEDRVKRNLEVSLARADRNYRQQNRVSETPEDVKRQHREEFEKAARELDSGGKLADMWNGDGECGGGGEKRPMFGYFGGVNFDKDGRIIR